jgi:error-prone DNA polymerase
MRKSGLTQEYAERVFQQIEGFGSYGFPESHAAAFAHLAYVSAYLKCHYPLEFAVALLNAQPMGFYSPSVILNDVRRHGLTVLRPDVQRSGWDSAAERTGTGWGLRMGLRLVRNVGEEVGRAIERARTEGGRFRAVEDLAHRAQVPSRALVALAAAGALESFGPRRQAIWRAAAAARPHGPLFAGVADPAEPPPLPPVGEVEGLALDGRYAQAFPDRHPMELLRERLTRSGVLSAHQASDVAAGCVVEVAGLVITRQRPDTPTGVVFLTLEDETGNVDVAAPADIFRRYQHVIRLSPALRIRGRMTTDGRAHTLSALHIAPLPFERHIPVDSHDFP